MRTPLLLLLIAGFLPGAVFAGLELDGKSVEVKPKPEDETVSALFTFTNKGGKAVKILELRSACSCLSATLDSPTYAAGAKGVGTAEFKVGSFVGRHEKTISVLTDDPEQPEWVVSFVLDVPEVVRIEPRSIQWWLGEEPAEKTATVKMTGPEPMKITNITATRTNVKFKWEEVVPGREYKILVTPDSTAEVTLGALKIETDSKIPKYQRQLAFFNIFRKPEGASQQPKTTVARQPVQ